MRQENEESYQLQPNTLSFILCTPFPIKVSYVYNATALRRIDELSEMSGSSKDEDKSRVDLNEQLI
jgi:hypothetical protein